jgi:hypothetical protein
MLDEVPDDVSYQRLKALIVAVFPPIQRAVPVYDPAHVARSVRAQRERRSCIRPAGIVQVAVDRMHGGEQLALLFSGKTPQHRPYLLIGTNFQWMKCALPFRGKREEALPSICGGSLAPY